LRKTALAPLLVWLVLSTYAAASELTVSEIEVTEDGVVWYEAFSTHNGPDATILRVLSPTDPAPGMSPRFIYVLPAIVDVDLESEFGDGLEELRALNVHNDYNAHIIAPSFLAEPWYADHASDPDRRYERFMIDHLVPWVEANLSVTGQEEHWLIGFSKSGFGAVGLLLRHPTVFDAAAVWDFPADQPDAYDFQMLQNYGTDANFQANYRLTSDFIAARKEPFQAARRLWLSDDFATYYGVPTFRDEVLAFAGRLGANDVLFRLEGGDTRPHTWSSGWLAGAVAGLQDMRYAGRDDFNRPDGPLGPSWVLDPAWGTGLSLSGGRVSAAPATGGAGFRAAEAFGADQYSQATLTGEIGDWAGVSVRGRVSPAQGYWAVVKADGVHLYAFDGAAFHALGHDPSPWTTGDVLRLEVRTATAGTARLTVYRDGSPLMTHDDAARFLDGGQPGLGLHAAAAVSLDDWQGGELNPIQPPPPPPSTTGADDFDRPDGALGPSWVPVPGFGNGASVSGNAVVAGPSSGGGYFWAVDAFGADQYSQITIAGDPGTWTGVVVRGRTSPAQGYWVAVKSDGAYLYALVDGVFHELVRDAAPWSTGDALRLEVQTVAAGTARLTVYRNGASLFSHDEPVRYIDSGQPGIGLYSTGVMALDDWQGGELHPDHDLPPPSEPTPPPHASSAADDFDRADGSLGSSWGQVPGWGTGTSISGHAVSSAHANGGAYFWDAHTFGADQYSEIAIAGAVGDWTGVAVRGSISPARGYWVAIKSDGAHLYSHVNQLFHELVHDATPWSTGDVLRLEVRTVAAGTARLTIYRNGTPLLAHEDALHFIESGRPGIGLYASGAMALDDWRGGEVDAGAPPPPPPPPPPPSPPPPATSAQDGFDRPDGDLGPSWVQAPGWGSGTSIAAGAVRSVPWKGGAYFWNADPFSPDQYSEIALAGEIGDWTGVSVRGGVAPAQGYWLAVKADGAYLYSQVSGVFYLLAYDPTPWATGDRLRLEVRTVATETARLAVLRNGSPLLVVDDAAHFIASGQPGIGLYAAGATAIDDWRGGALSPGE